jgi:hypothetical protein
MHHHFCIYPVARKGQRGTGHAGQLCKPANNYVHIRPPEQHPGHPLFISPPPPHTRIVASLRLQTTWWAITASLSTHPRSASHHLLPPPLPPPAVSHLSAGWSGCVCCPGASSAVQQLGPHHNLHRLPAPLSYCCSFLAGWSGCVSCCAVYHSITPPYILSPPQIPLMTPPPSPAVLHLHTGWSGCVGCPGASSAVHQLGRGPRDAGPQWGRYTCVGQVRLSKLCLSI